MLGVHPPQGNALTQKPRIAEPQIVAIGGGGFLDGSEHLALEIFILGLANKPKPN